MITKHTVWMAVCGGCVSEYGDGGFFAEALARAFVNENPLCADCDGENY